ncbi:MAG: glycosyltransferase family 4 protein [Verrucomicrobiae bacterium]|nr:glycosyltransferase family 4 protein [Verrucomicrobiae bacterium]
MARVRILHGFTFFSSLGGVESMLQRHHKVDELWGIDSTFCAYFEPRTTEIPRVKGLGLSGLSCIHTARKRFRSCMTTTVDVMVYHNLWGLAFFADLDHASRRMGVLHTDVPGLGAWLRHVRGMLDGILCASEPLLDMVRRELPELGGDRLAWLPYPVALSRTEANQEPIGKRPFVLGFAGRLSFEQKRVDRFPELVRALDMHHVHFRFEFLGDGPQSDWLKKQLGNDPRVRFHGRLSGSAYWEVLRGWDGIVFVSDYEGLPISLLEAMAVGVLPIVPGVGSGADAYVRNVRRDLLYPPGDVQAAAVVIKNLANSSAPEIQGLRQRANKLAEPHLGDCYERAFSDQLLKVVAMPRISVSSFSRVIPCPRMLVPFGILRRFWLDALWEPVFRRA